MTDGFDAGGIVPGPDDLTVRWRGTCPLDGYPLIEVDDIELRINGERITIEGEWDHVVPPSSFRAALERIADAHGFEVSASAEAILRSRP